VRAAPDSIITLRMFIGNNSYVFILCAPIVVEVVTASPDRIEPLCPHFESCGGCQYQHISLDAQRKLKRRQVADALTEAGLEVAPFDDGSGVPSTGLETSLVVRPVEGTLHAYGYRDKLNPQVRYSKNEDGGSVRVGFQRKGGHTVIDIEACVIATDSINRELKAIREAVVRRYASLQPGVPSLAPGLAKHKRILKNGENLLLRSAGPDATFVGTKHEDVIEQRVKGVSFRYKAGEFFQNNSHVLPLLVDFVLGQARGGAGGGTGSECDHLIDAYCGSGLFSLCAARHQAAPGSMEPAFREVIGVEISRVAVASARANAERNGLTGVRFLAGDSAQLFHGVAALLPTERTAVVIDPPRSGCDEPFLRQLLAFAPRKLVYVSCDVVTQARDAAFLTAAVMDSSSDGGIGRSRYCITDCTPFDLFPQTRHIENVITFVKTDC
jgi:tRNA/tmRNA/rRNA uracil-C5-methylase (TrmA/RlmC/RlmD family)